MSLVQVSDLMTPAAVTDDPDDTLAEACARMRSQQTGSLLVMEGARLTGIVTERDVLRSLGTGQDPDSERVADHLTSELVFASPDWSLEEAAAAMVRGSFRHLIVVEHGEVTGILSVRDIIRCWSQDGATSDMPRSAATA